ncbi:MAG: enoyl-CoA hydratase/isomerase family protein [Pseudooceanicola sp.]|nr:enoyl-CoA hydratase/isomerase family protein [Pseudooceanicola sp.]
MPDVTATTRLGVTVLTLGNGRANAVTPDMADALAAQVAALGDIGALVIRGAGAHFCAGSDVGELARLHEAGQGAGPLLRRESAAFEAIAALDIPVIAAVEGLCLGGGLELALCCDLIVAGDTARFGLPEAQLGAFPALGAPLRLPRRIGTGRALEMMLDGTEIDAATARDWGLVNRTVPAARALPEAETWAIRLAQGPRAARRALKRSLRAALALPEAEAIAAMLREAETLDRSPEITEGLRAFAARETPAFQAKDEPAQ